MNSKETFEKISKRNKYVMSCGNLLNNTYDTYLNVSLSYDNLKKGFYIALDLSRYDDDVPEQELERYAHLVKHFDQQLLNQFKERSYAIKKIEIEQNVEKSNFHDRITKIETEGLLRNRAYFEFIDDKAEFDKAKELFYNETSLAVKDGLITDIEQKIHNESMKITEKHFEERLTTMRQFYKEKRENVYHDRCRYDQGRTHCGQGRTGRGQGRAGRGQGRIGRGQGRTGRGQGRIGRGQGRTGRGQGRTVRGRGRNGRNQGRNNHGHGENLYRKYEPYQYNNICQ